jgi:hypothetical protein
MNGVIMTLARAVAPVAAFAHQVPQPLSRPAPLPATDSLGVLPVVLVVPTGRGPALVGVLGGWRGRLGRHHARVPIARTHQRAAKPAPRQDPHRRTPPAGGECLALPAHAPTGETR